MIEFVSPDGRSWFTTPEHVVAVHQALEGGKLSETLALVELRDEPAAVERFVVGRAADIARRVWPETPPSETRRLAHFSSQNGDPVAIDPRVVRGLRGDAKALGHTAIDYVVGAQYICIVVRGSLADVAAALGIEAR